MHPSSEVNTGSIGISQWGRFNIKEIKSKHIYANIKQRGAFVIYRKTVFCIPLLMRFNCNYYSTQYNVKLYCNTCSFSYFVKAHIIVTTIFSKNYGRVLDGGELG